MSKNVFWVLWCSKANSDKKRLLDTTFIHYRVFESFGSRNLLKIHTENSLEELPNFSVFRKFGVILRKLSLKSLLKTQLSSQASRKLYITKNV